MSPGPIQLDQATALTLMLGPNGSVGIQASESLVRNRCECNGCRSDIYNGVNNLQAHYRWYVTDCF